MSQPYVGEIRMFGAILPLRVGTLPGPDVALSEFDTLLI